MKTKNRKLHQLIGILLCLVMLIGMMPIQTAVALADPVAQSDEIVKYQKITSTTELVKGNKYVITYKDASENDTKYALSSSETNNTANVALRGGDTLLVDPEGSYVLELTKDSGPYKFKANDGSGIRLNNGGIFDPSNQGDITLIYDGAYWSLNNTSARALTFSNGAFGMTTGKTDNPQSDFEIWTPAPASTDYIKLASVDQLADFNDDTEFVIVLETENGLKAMGTTKNGTWLHDVKTFKDIDGTEYISVDDTYPVVFNSHGAFTSGTVNKVKYCGFDSSGIRLKGSSNYFYPQSVGNTSAPFRNKSGQNNTVHFEYGTGNADGNYSDKIYIRGNANSSYLGYKDGNWTGSLAYNSEYRVPVQIYVAISKTAVKVEYLNAAGDVSKIAYAEKDGTLTLMNNVKDEEHGGYTYAFVGWTMTKPENPFLSLDDSCNIFDYDNEEEKAQILDTVAEKYGLIGDCNPDYSDAVIDMQTVEIEEDEPLQLYPIYAVKGFDTVVAALEADDTKIIGVSDWKADPEQGLDSYFNGGSAEKWLGYIDVQIFKDGVEWVAPTRLYFRYHNDNTADLSIKFIWDDLLENSKYQDPTGELDPLFIYMSDHNQYPEFDQSGHYVLDAVYAYQGGSEDGLKYSLNWMTDHGGQLDNVEGGSLVQLFVSTKYSVKYYLDNKEITEPAWTSDNYYTTPGTSELFNSVAADADYTVRFDNDLNGLLDRDFVEDDDPDKEIVYSDKQAKDEEGNLLYDEDGNPIYEIIYNPHEWFIAEGEDGERGEPEYYSYLMHEYEHVIPLAKTPEELVPEGKTLISKMWSLKDKNLKVQSAHNWSSDYALEGTQHGTGNTAASYFDGVATFAADDPYTFHLYAYTGIPGDLTVSKTVTGNQGETDRDFHFTVTVDNEDINGVYGDMEFSKGVAEFTLKHDESKTASGLPAGATYKVVEAEANQDSYSTTANNAEGKILAKKVVTAEFINDRSVELGTADITITNTVTGEGADMDKEFHYILELSDKSVNGQYGDLYFVDGVAEFTLKNGESVTATGLPDGVSYTVLEVEFNEDGYTSTVTLASGTLSSGEPIQVDFVNDKPIDKPADPEEPEEPTTEEPTTEEPTTEEPTTEAPAKPSNSPNTGDVNQLALWMSLMVASLLGFAICFFFSRKKTYGTK